MPVIGWIFIILAIGMIIGSLLLLRDTAHSMPISKETLEKAKGRQAKLEAEEKKDKSDDTAS